MKRILKKLLMTFLAIMIIMGCLYKNSLISDSLSYNENKVLLVQPFYNTKDKDSNVKSIEPTVEKYYPNTTVLQGDKINYISTLNSYINKHDIVIFFTHGNDDFISLSKEDENGYINSEKINSLDIKKDSIYIVGACKVSEKNENFAKALIKKGSKAVYTYNQIINDIDTEKQIKKLLKSLEKNKTPKEAYNNAIRGFENGNGLVLTTKL